MSSYYKKFLFNNFSNKFLLINVSVSLQLQSYRINEKKKFLYQLNFQNFLSLKKPLIIFLKLTGRQPNKLIN